MPPAALPGAKLLPILMGFKNSFRINFVLKADVIWPEGRGAKRIRNLFSRWHTLPPEAFF